MAEEAIRKFTSVTLVEQTGEAIETPLRSGFVEYRYLPFAQENKHSSKVDKGSLERHVLSYLGASRLSDISTDFCRHDLHRPPASHSPEQRSLEVYPETVAPRKYAVAILHAQRHSPRIHHLAVAPVSGMFGRSDLRHSFANFLVYIGVNQRDHRNILGYYKPESLALVRNNSFENNVRAQ